MMVILEEKVVQLHVKALFYGILMLMTYAAVASRKIVELLQLCTNTESSSTSAFFSANS
jgi:hypothetical protein